VKKLTVDKVRINSTKVYAIILWQPHGRMLSFHRIRLISLVLSKLYAIGILKTD